MLRRIAVAVLIATLAGAAHAGFPEGLIVMAHRGIVTDTITENSLESLEECIRRGYTHMEVDLRCTKDGHAVALHDRSLKRTYGVDAYVDELTLDELRTHVSENEVPTFETVCKTAQGRLNFMPDVKQCPPELLDAFTESIVTNLTTYGLMENAHFIGIDEVKNVVKGKARVSFGGTVEEARAAIAENPDFVKERFVFGHGEDFTQENVDAFQALGLPVIVSINTFHYLRGNPQEDGDRHIGEMLALGVDGLQIDSVYEDAIHEAIGAK